MSAHDRYLAQYSHALTEVWCSNVACENREGVDVDLETEYGMSWTTPEECPLCHSEWLLEPPEEEDE